MIIDIHAHLSPPEAAERFPMPPSLTDVDGMIAARDDAGIDLTIIGSPVGTGAMMRVPGVDNYRQPRDRLRSFHDWLSGLVARYPSQLRAYVYVNPLGGSEEIDAAVGTLDDPAFVGFIINSSVAGRYLDHPQADEFFAAAAQTRRPVLVHPPAEPIGGSAVEDFRFVEQVGRFCDVTAGLAMLAFAGWLSKYPELTLIGATGGGAIATLGERLDAAARSRHWTPQAKLGESNAVHEPSEQPSRALRRVFTDTAIESSAHLKMNVEIFGAQHVLFGTDSPPLVRPLREALDAIYSLPLTEPDHAAVLGGNAAKLFDVGNFTTHRIGTR